MGNGIGVCGRGAIENRGYEQNPNPRSPAARHRNRYQQARPYSNAIIGGRQGGARRPAQESRAAVPPLMEMLVPIQAKGALAAVAAGA